MKRKQGEQQGITRNKKRKVREENIEKGHSHCISVVAAELINCQKIENIDDMTDESFNETALGLQSLANQSHHCPISPNVTLVCEGHMTDVGAVSKEGCTVTEISTPSQECDSVCTYSKSVTPVPIGRLLENEDADVLIKIQKQCATIDTYAHQQSHYKSDSCIVKHLATATDISSTEHRKQESLLLHQTNSNWLNNSRSYGIRAESVGKSKTELDFQANDNLTLKDEVSCQSIALIPSCRAEKSDEINERKNNGSHLCMNTVDVDLKLKAEEKDRMTAAAALTAVGQPLIGQPLIGQPCVVPLSSSLSQPFMVTCPTTPLVGEPQVLPLPIRQHTLTSDIYTMLPISEDAGPASSSIHEAAPTQHFFFDSTNKQPYHDLSYDFLPHPIHPTYEAPVPSSSTSTESAECSNLLNDVEFKAEEVAAFEVLAEWSSMSALSHQRMESPCSVKVDNDPTIDSLHSSDSNFDGMQHCCVQRGCERREGKCECDILCFVLLYGAECYLVL